MRLTGRAVPNILAMALPWVSLALAIGIGGHLSGQSDPGWQVSRFVTSIGASAVLVTCAGIYSEMTPLPYRTGLGWPLFRYLMWWLPLAGSLLALIAQGIATLIVPIAVLFAGRLSMVGLGETPGAGAPQSWRLAQILRASVGSLACFLFTPAIVMILLVPILGALAVAGIDMSFLEETPTSLGGALTSSALASEFFAALLPHLAMATVGFYQGALLREWTSSSKPIHEA